MGGRRLGPFGRRARPVRLMLTLSVACTAQNAGNKAERQEINSGKELEKEWSREERGGEKGGGMNESNREVWKIVGNRLSSDPSNLNYKSICIIRYKWSTEESVLLSYVIINHSVSILRFQVFVECPFSPYISVNPLFRYP